MKSQISEIQLSAVQESVEKYFETYVPKEDIKKVKQTLRAQGETVLPKSRLRKALCK